MIFTLLPVLLANFKLQVCTGSECVLSFITRRAHTLHSREDSRFSECAVFVLQKSQHLLSAFAVFPLQDKKRRNRLCLLLQHTATHCNTLQHDATHCHKKRQNLLCLLLHSTHKTLSYPTRHSHTLHPIFTRHSHSLHTIVSEAPSR